MVLIIASFLTMISVLIIVLPLLISIFFALSLHKTLRLAPVSYYAFPLWFVWMTLIPIANLIFFWIILPFGVPKTLELVNENADLQKKTKYLFLVGLTFVISYSVFVFFKFFWDIAFLSFLASLITIASFITYWILIIKIRKNLI